MINLNALLEKEIISLIDGSKIGEIYDVEIDEFTGRIVSIIVIKPCFLMCKKDKQIIPWEKVKVIGNDTILVDVVKNSFKVNKKGNLLKSFLD